MTTEEIREILNETLAKHGYSPGEVKDLTIKEVQEILGIRVARQIMEIHLN